MKRSVLKAQLVKHEGLRLKPYRCTEGKLTIGVGRNFQDRPFSADERKALRLDEGRDLADGITEAEAMLLLDNDINEAFRVCNLCVPAFSCFSDACQHGLLDLAFNLGQTKFTKFKKMLAALERRDQAAAAREARDSEWFHQVGDRGPAVVALIGTP